MFQSLRFWFSYLLGVEAGDVFVVTVEVTVVLVVLVIVPPPIIGLEKVGFAEEEAKSI